MKKIQRSTLEIIILIMVTLICVGILGGFVAYRASHHKKARTSSTQTLPEGPAKSNDSRLNK